MIFPVTLFMEPDSHEKSFSASKRGPLWIKVFGHSDQLNMKSLLWTLTWFDGSAQRGDLIIDT